MYRDDKSKLVAGKDDSVNAVVQAIGTKLVK